jgi:hypothetical protein
MSETGNLTDHIDGERIRKVWHNDEWYYSVIDMIAVLLDADHKRAKIYWATLKSRLKAEGNETLTNCNRLKLPALDGKMRLTDVVNTEQALRLIQSIPSPKVEPMKLWLAQVGAERLEETEDPESGIMRAMEQAGEKYRRMGRSESWIEARIQGIVTRKEFVEALKNAVLHANVTLYSAATEKLYVGLWERTTAELRKELNITRQQNPRDYFGEYALIYTRLAEKLAGDMLGKHETVSFTQAKEIVFEVAKMIGLQAQATAHALGMDLVTERKLLTS